MENNEEEKVGTTEDGKNAPPVYNIEKGDAQFAYENLVSIHNMEINSFWKRITLMLAIQAILFAVLSSDSIDFASKSNPLLIPVLIFGLITSLISVVIIQGSSWWIDHWEKDKLPKLEPYIGIDGFEIFRNHPHFDLNKQTPGYFSSRKWVKFLFFCLVILWAFILLFALLSHRENIVYFILGNQTKIC